MKKTDKNKIAAQRRKTHSERTGRSLAKRFGDGRVSSTFDPADLVVTPGLEEEATPDASAPRHRNFFRRTLDIFTKIKVRNV